MDFSLPTVAEGLIGMKTIVALFLTFSSLLSAASQLGLSTSTVGPINIVPGSNEPLRPYRLSIRAAEL